MDTVPNFLHILSDLDNKEDAMHILKHEWGKLNKQEQKVLYPMMALFDLSHKNDKESKEECEEYKQQVYNHPEIVDLFNKFYTKVVTPVSSKDHFKNDRIKAAAGLEKVVKELNHKHLIKNFEIKRVA